LIPDAAVFWFLFKAWSPRITPYVKGFHNAEEEKKGLKFDSPIMVFAKKSRRETALIFIW